MSLLAACRPGSSARLTLQLYVRCRGHPQAVTSPHFSRARHIVSGAPSTGGTAWSRQTPAPIASASSCPAYPPEHRFAPHVPWRHVCAHGCRMGPLWPRVYSLPCVTPLSEWQTLGSDPQISTTHTDKLPYFSSSCIARQPWNRITSFRLGHTNPCTPTRFNTPGILKLQRQIEAKTPSVQLLYALLNSMADRT
jgi:hypothetical protein